MVRHVTELTAESVKARWGALLQAAREKRGETQMHLAVRMACDISTISRTERGRGDLERFLAMAQALDVELPGPFAVLGPETKAAGK